MEIDKDLIEKIWSSSIPLIGVVLGSVLVTVRESSREKERIKRESSYLAILVVAHLDRFINECVSVAFDDGTCEGVPAGENGYHQATCKPPSFDPLSLSVDWKVLPADLMYGILSLPYQVEQLAHHLSVESDFDEPPDFIRFFWARRMGFAALGLEVLDLVKRLRKHAKLPAEKPLENDISREAMLMEVRDKIASKIAAYEAR